MDLMRQLQADPMFRAELQNAIRQIESEEAEAKVKKEGGVRRGELMVWLNDCKIIGLSLGETRVRSSGIEEQYGIYRNGVHIGDIHSDGLRFSRPEFDEEASRVLAIAGIGRAPGNELFGSRVTFNIDSNVLRRIIESGVRIAGHTWTFKNGTQNMYGDGENAYIEVKEVGDGKFALKIFEKEGKVIEYEINNGALDVASRKGL